MKHCRHNNSEITIKHYTDSQQLPEEWNAFVPRNHFLQSSQLSVTENASLPDISFLYVQVFIKGKSVLASGFQLLNLKAKHFNSGMVRRLPYTGWQLFTGLLHPKLLVGGHLFRHDVASVYCPEQVSGYEAYSYYKEAIDEAMSISCASAVVIKDMPEQLATYFRNFDPEYIMLRNDISMEMDIPAEWTGIQDYEKALKHKYAQRYRKISQSLQGFETRELNLQEVEQHKQELYDLYRQVTDHQQVRIGFISPEFLPVLKKHDDRLKIWGGYHDGKMVGFFSAWVHEDAFDMFYIGFDYEKNKELNLYFNILFFAIEEAIQFKKPKLILGRTALDAKARLGCLPKYLSTFVYIKNRFVRQRIMQVQKNTTDREGAWESRHPFKNATN